MFRFYLGNILLPIAPDSLSVTLKNKNTSVNLLDESEYTILRKNGLTSYSFKVILPSKKYHFTFYDNDVFKEPEYFLEQLERYKSSKSVFDFTVLSPEYTQGIINKRVNLEELSYQYMADGSSDILMQITLKEYSYITTKAIMIKDNSNNGSDGSQTARPPSTVKLDSEYIIKSGDTLWCLAKTFYGDPWKYTIIYNANKTLLDSIAKSRGFPSESGDWWIFPGTKITIPAI